MERKSVRSDSNGRFRMTQCTMAEKGPSGFLPRQRSIFRWNFRLLRRADLVPPMTCIARGENINKSKTHATLKFSTDNSA